MHLVSWKFVTTSLDQTEWLGIMELCDMNTVLAAKWYTVFDNKEALWRKVVCAKSRGNIRGLMSNLEQSDDHLVLLRYISSVLVRNAHGCSASTLEILYWGW